MKTWALLDKARKRLEPCNFQVRILEKRTDRLRFAPYFRKTIILKAILEHVRSSELTRIQQVERVQIPPPLRHTLQVLYFW